jgi:hypothetical protein
MITSSISSRTSSRTRRTSFIVPHPLRMGLGTGRLELVLIQNIWAQYKNGALPPILSNGTKCRQRKDGYHE